MNLPRRNRVSASGWRRPRRTRGPARRGVLLLEVVLSLAIMLMAIAALGVAFGNSLASASKAERLTRAMLLTDDVLTRFDMGLFVQAQQNQQTEQTVSGALPVPGLTYELEVKPDEQEPELLRVTATVFDQTREQTATSEAERVPLLVTHALRPKYKAVNLKEDFGMTDEQCKTLTDAIPGGTQVLDPENFDPTSLARMDMDSLTQFLPVIMAALQSGQLQGAMGGMQGGDLSSMQRQLQQQQGGGQGGGQRGGGQSGGQAGSQRGGSGQGSGSGGSGPRGGGQSGSGSPPSQPPGQKTQPRAFRTGSGS
ncbi:MAG: hypothetical protein U1A27_08810 [Phycisphaerae bacterium]